MALDLGIPDPPRWLVACLMAALIVISSTGCVPADADAARLGSTYSDILLRELRTDREALMELRDSVALERDLALLWVDWIDEEAVPPSHTLMEGARNLARPTIPGAPPARRRGDGGARATGRRCPSPASARTLPTTTSSRSDSTVWGEKR